MVLIDQNKFEKDIFQDVPEHRKRNLVSISTWRVDRRIAVTKYGLRRANS